MSRTTRMYLRFDDWPADDQTRWKAAFKTGDLFDESGLGAHLAESTRKAWKESYGRFLGFISASHPDLLSSLPHERVNRTILAEYADWRRTSCGEFSLSIDLDHLRGALKLICPGVDWSWLLTITKRIAAAAPRGRPTYHLVTSERLYALGLQLMDGAVTDADAGQLTKAHAFQYRDGLMVALLALNPMRRRTFTAIRIGKQLLKTGDAWALDLPTSDTKSGRPLDYPIPGELSSRIDLYLHQFRSRIPGAGSHTSPWASNHGRPICAGAIYDAVRKRTKNAFGFAVNLHRFRHAAATFWSIHDPANVHGAKDLLGQVSFHITEKHYIMGQSRLAGRAVARIVDQLRR